MQKIGNYIYRSYWTNELSESLIRDYYTLKNRNKICCELRLENAI